MSKANLKTTINANIKQNGVQAITGQVLNGVLNQMVDGLADQTETSEKLTELEEELNRLVDYSNEATISGYIFKNGDVFPHERRLCTPHLSIKGASYIVCRGVSSADCCSIAFYNSNKEFISGYANAIYDNVQVTISKEDIPISAEFIRCTFHVVNGGVAKVMFNKIDEIVSESEIIKSSLHKKDFIITENEMYRRINFISSQSIIGESQYYNFYQLENKGYKSIEVTTSADLADNAPCIMLYSSEEVSSSNLISRVIATNSQMTTYHLVIPDNCKLIIGQIRVNKYIKSNGSGVVVRSDAPIEDVGITLGLRGKSINKIKDDFMQMIHLDCGRKYFSPANIKKLIDMAHNAQCNYVELYFSDNQGFRFGLNDMNVSANGITYDLSQCLGDGISTTSSEGTKSPDGSNKWLTESEMVDIISYARSLGIGIIPCLDMPSHMGCILNKFPSFKHVGSNVDIELNNTSAVNFVLAILDKYATFFSSCGCDYFNFGGDEVTYMNSGIIDIYNSFIEKASRIVMSNGLTPIAFNEALYYGGLNNTTNTKIISSYWSKYGSGASVKEQASMGIQLINTNSAWYWVLGMNSMSALSLKAENVNKFHNNQFFYNPKGACFCIWCDFAQTDGADDGDKVLADVAGHISCFGYMVNKTRNR